MRCFVPELTQEIDGERGQARIGQEPHRSRAKRVKLIPRQRRGVRESLPNVFLVEVWEIGDDLRRCHAVGDEVDDIGLRTCFFSRPIFHLCGVAHSIRQVGQESAVTCAEGCRL